MINLIRMKSSLLFSIVFIIMFSSGISSPLSSYVHESLPTEELSIVVGPYPQNPGLNSTIIIWQTSAKTSVNGVCYGLNISCENVVYDNLTSDFHKMKINNLNPSTKYYYKVFAEDIESNVYTFNTVYSKNKTIKFIVYGDTRGVWDSWKNASIVAKGIENEQPNFVLHTGDIVNDGTIQKQWIDYFSISSFIHNSTIYPAIGNHEYLSIYYSKYFITNSSRYWYSFDYGPAHLIGLDSNTVNAFNLRQLIWLLKDLKQNTRPVVFVFFHHPPYSSGNHGSLLHLRFLWGAIFRYYDVDMVFNGHDHSYERGYAKDTHYIVTGGGGAPLYNVGEKWWTVYSEKTFHYCVIEVNEDKVSFVAKRPDGTVFDSFSYEI